MRIGRSLLALVVVLAAALVGPRVARADENAFTQGVMNVEDDAVVFAVEARSALRFPSVHTDRGFVRVRFPQMTGWSHVDVEGDGRAVRFARIRPGAEDSGVVVVRLGDMRDIPESAVSVTLDGPRARIAIARSVLAPVREAAPAPVVAAPVVAAPVAAAPVAAAPVVAAAAPETIGDAAPAVEAPRPRAVLGVDTTSSNLPMLAAITALLGAIYLVVRHVQQRAGAGAAKQGIRVIASHRIGPKQQLLVVRVLGQDHFLSVDGAHTERLCSVPADETSPDPAPASVLAKLGLAGSSASAPVSAPGQQAAHAFGAHLLRIAAPAPGAVAAKGTTQGGASVRGIMELRAKAGR